jgi:hypothetical protein
MGTRVMTASSTRSRRTLAVWVVGAVTVVLAFTVLAPAAQAQGTLLTGANHTGTIAVSQQLHEWTFTAEQGDYVALSAATVQVIAGSFAPWIRLISPTGQVLGNAQGAVAQINLTVPMNGTFRVIAGSRSGTTVTGTGHYRLTLARVPGGFVVPDDDEGGPLTNGANHGGTIHPGDLDLWTFTAAQGDYVALSAGTIQVIAGSFAPWIRLISPTGQVLGNTQGAVAQINLAIPTSGTYTVIAGSRSGTTVTGTGHYRLTLARVPGGFVVPDDDEGGPLTTGANHGGTIHLGDLDLWTFTAAQGSFVTLSAARVQTIAGSFAPWIRLISPTGQVLGNAQGAVAQVNLNAPMSGTFTVIVGSRSGTTVTGTGHYALTVLGAIDGCLPSVHPTAVTAQLAGGPGTLTVSAGQGCAWTAGSNAPWIAVTGGASGTGNGSVAFTVEPNHTGSVRTGTLTVAGHTVTVTQPAAATTDCTFTVTPTGLDAPASGASPTVEVTASAPACAWTAASDAEWITVFSGATGTGSGSVALDVHPNPTTLISTGTVTIAGRQVTITREASTFEYPLSEGATGPLFDMDIAIANPNDEPAPATLVFLRPATQSGEALPPLTQSVTLAPRSRLTLRANDVPGLARTSVSTVVLSEAELPLVVERTMYWDDQYYAGHTEIAPERPALTWYFGEGSQGFFDTYVLLGNGTQFTAQATVTFLPEDGIPVVRTYEVAPSSRHTVYVGDIPELVGRSFSIVVESTIPIVSERAMYFGAERFWEGGHGSAGVIELSRHWFHAEGATEANFATYILVGNPNPQPANVTFTWLTIDGTVVSRVKTIAPNARLTVSVADEDPRLAHTSFSTTVSSDVPVVSERAMYWPGDWRTWHGAHNSFGLTSVGTRWGLAEGKVGRGRNFATFILLSNGNTMPAEVTVMFLRTAGAPVVKSYVVPPLSRFNVWVNGMVPELRDEEFGAVVEVTNGVPIAVERAMYWDAVGQVWAGGTNAAGVRLP